STQRVDGVGPAGMVDLNGRDVEKWIGLNCEAHHAEPVLRRCRRLVGFVRRLPHWDEENARQVQRGCSLLRRDEMAVVDGIEGATHHAESYGFLTLSSRGRGGDRYVHSSSKSPMRTVSPAATPATSSSFSTPI